MANITVGPYTAKLVHIGATGLDTSDPSFTIVVEETITRLSGDVTEKNTYRFTKEEVIAAGIDPATWLNTQKTLAQDLFTNRYGGE